MTYTTRPSLVTLAGLLAALVCFGAASAAQTRAEAPPAPAGPAPAPSPSSPPDPVTVRTELDRTAVWVADRLTYTIAITCARGVDILVDDLSRDKLKADGLEVIGGDVARHADDNDVTRYEFRYTLTTYRVDNATPKIAPIGVRYYVKRPGQRAQDAPPAGTVQVPGAVVAFRSLLPDDQPTYAIRDGRAAAPPPAIYRALQPIGLGLILLSLVPVALAAVAVARRLQQRRQQAGVRSRREVRQAARARLDAVRDADPTMAETRREAFTTLDALVREHVRDVAGVHAPSLTPAEIAAELEPRAARLPVELVTAVLTTCELARYAPPERLPPADAWRETLASAEQVLAAGR